MQTGLADQDVFNLVALHVPEWFRELPCEWNVQVHANSHGDCFRARGARVVHWNSPSKHEARHARRQFFRDLLLRTWATDGYALAQSPLQCGGATDASVLMRAKADENEEEDECNDLVLAGTRVYRTHPRLHTYALVKQLYDCSLKDSPAPSFKVLAASVTAAQQLYIGFLRKQGRAHGPSPVVACQAIPREAAAAEPSAVVALSTHLSIDRLGLLAGLLRAWDGPISVAIYLRDADLPDLATGLERLDIPHATPLSIHAVFRPSGS